MAGRGMLAMLLLAEPVLGDLYLHVSAAAAAQRATSRGSNS
jgi:hypothetical protein